MTTIVALSAGQLGDPRKQLAVLAAAVSLPGCAWYLLAAVDHAKRYDFSVLMQWIPPLSAILAAMAFGLWLEGLANGVGIAFGLMTVGIGLISESAERRAKEKREALVS